MKRQFEMFIFMILGVSGLSIFAFSPLSKMEHWSYWSGWLMGAGIGWNLHRLYESILEWRIGKAGKA